MYTTVKKELQQEAKNLSLYYQDVKGNKSFEPNQYAAILNWQKICEGGSITREEATVISIERWLVNPNMKIVPTWEWSYGQALKKLYTTLTKGWATRFCILNIEELSRLDKSLLIHAKNILSLKYPEPRPDLLTWKGLLENSESLSPLSASKMWIKEERRVIKFDEKFLMFFTLEKLGEIIHLFEIKEVVPKKVAITKYV